MKLKKYFVFIALAANLVACAHNPEAEKPVVQTKKAAVTKGKKEKKVFDVIGNTDGENDLDYDEYIDTSKFSVDDSYTVAGKTYTPKINIDYKETGVASWYGGSFHGRKTSSGVVFDKGLYTAAHKELPIPCVVRVVNLKNQRSVLVVVNDRGPFSGNRIIDLSSRSAGHLGFLNNGLGKVRVEYLYKETRELLNKLPSEQRNKALLAYQKALTTEMAKEAEQLNIKNLS